MGDRSVYRFAFGSLFGVTALAVAAFWFFAVRAPSAELQCDHVMELVKKETGNEAGASFRATCVARLEKGANEGLIPYADRSKCVIAARSLERASRCHRDAAN
jgi:hypothetical protein